MSDPENGTKYQNACVKVGAFLGGGGGVSQHGGVGRVVVGGGAGVQAVVGDGHLSAAVLRCPRLQLAHPAADQ